MVAATPKTALEKGVAFSPGGNVLRITQKWTFPAALMRIRHRTNFSPNPSRHENAPVATVPILHHQWWWSTTFTNSQYPPLPGQLCGHTAGRRLDCAVFLDFWISLIAHTSPRCKWSIRCLQRFITIVSSPAYSKLRAPIRGNKKTPGAPDFYQSSH
jgi:hypothetical protein